MNQPNDQRIAVVPAATKVIVGSDAAHGNKHVDLTQPSDANEALMPHERDEKVGMTGGVPSPLVEQAARDLKRGIEDTSRSVEADKAYKKLKSS
jgi:phosphoribosylanthranilate isomerase